MVRNEAHSRYKFAREAGLKYFAMMQNSHKTGYNIMASIYTDKLNQARRICLHYADEYMQSCGNVTKPTTNMKIYIFPLLLAATAIILIVIASSQDYFPGSVTTTARVMFYITLVFLVATLISINFGRKERER